MSEMIGKIEDIFAAYNEYVTLLATTPDAKEKGFMIDILAKESRSIISELYETNDRSSIQEILSP